MTSITPPVQAPYLLKCVPDRVTDDGGAMISDVILRMRNYRPQEGRWLTRTVLDHSGRECFVIRMRYCSVECTDYYSRVWLWLIWCHVPARLKRSI